MYSGKALRDTASWSRNRQEENWSYSAVYHMHFRPAISYHHYILSHLVSFHRHLMPSSHLPILQPPHSPHHNAHQRRNTNPPCAPPNGCFSRRGTLPHIILI